MNGFVEKMKDKVINGGKITKEEAKQLYFCDLDELTNASCEIRNKFCGNVFDFCAIVNAKSGMCSENCKFCAQSSFYNTTCQDKYPLNEKLILEGAEICAKEGVKRYSMVASGRGLNDTEVDRICELNRKIREKMLVCVSGGLMNKEQFAKLKAAGVDRIHCNVETSRNNFKNICTTHTYDDKIKAIHAAAEAGLEVCSGGIIGMGESLEDRIDMAFDLRELNIKSVPVNILNPIKGTPFEQLKPLEYDEIMRTIAMFRFILPDSLLRLAGGRKLLADRGEKCIKAGANAAITGDMLTTVGVDFSSDIEMIRKMGFEY